MLRPRFRLPLWAAVAIPAAAYVVRSLIRGSFAPDMPQDAIAYGLLALVVLAVGIGRARLAHPIDNESEDDAPDHRRAHDDKSTHNIEREDK